MSSPQLNALPIPVTACQVSAQRPVEGDLSIVVAQDCNAAIVGPADELPAGPGRFAAQGRAQVIAIEMHFVRPVRIGDCPVRNAARPPVQLCCPYQSVKMAPSLAILSMLGVR